MGIQVETSFHVPASIGEAWSILIDIPRIAPCLPGAEITEAVDATTYKGTARVKIGPVQLLFKGDARLHDVDLAAHRSKLSVRGTDTKGRGNAQGEMAFSLATEGEGTTVHVVTDIVLSGSVAQYGRGAGLIKAICNEYADQFARNLAAQIERGSVPAGGAAEPVSAIGLVAGAVRAMVARKAGSDGGAS